MSRSNYWWSFLIIIFISASSLPKSTAQNATTDPSEVRALNAIFQKWDIQLLANATWNFSGEPCSGSAIDNEKPIEHKDNNPGIKCNCTYDDNKTCHITHLRVEFLDKQGQIPEEITALKYLTYFKILLNYFTGTLPTFLANLTEMQYLDVGHNAFHGTIPKEFGGLKNLIMLAVGSNNFSGSLPAELGNLPNLELIYIDSSGISGEIPNTFAKLQKVRVLAALDTPLSGKIPDFIGNWTRLTNLTLIGNTFEGPIPSTFSQLTSLESLKIGDIYKGSSSLDFIKNFKNLTELVLRNALVSGPIPSNFSELVPSLILLDLSFNNLTGSIPSSFFDMNSLTHLFLGNNSLSGSIYDMSWKQNLENIDLSYNHLSGRLPPWSHSVTQLNIAANDYVFNDTNNSEMHCLQRSFPCNKNKNTPLDTSFAIKCGGPQMIGRNGVVYEAEDRVYLGPAQTHVTDKWGVSKVGLYADKAGDLDMEDTKANVTGSDEDPEFFKTARMSPGSLRYYGFGLENGPYIVTLHFAEIGFPNRSTNKWASLARRMFDIYIQGNLVAKDYDISKKAGGVEKAKTEVYNATVSDNYLEIHLFWAGKGTCCIPRPGYYGPLIAGLHASANFKPRRKENNTGIIVGIIVPVAALGLMLLLTVFYRRRKSRRDDEEEFLGIANRPNTFSYSELKAATRDFSQSNKIGEGGFGSVYKGTLSDGRVVAVKQLSLASHQGKEEFITEIATISVVQHRNLVKLYGCCFEGNKCILVYEYLENGSLDQALFGKNDLRLNWETRFNVCVGTAKGLAYLHEESRPRIVHRDVKASNILLDEALSPKISDFGLAKHYDESKTHMSTRVAGTIGYLAPEYALRGHLTEKADIFGFGVVALEIVSGRPNFATINKERVYLLDRAWSLYENNLSLELVDPNLKEFDEDEVFRMIKVAFLCTQASPMMRPSMSRVVGLLAGDIEIDGMVSRPSYLADLESKDQSSSIFTSVDFTSSTMSKEMSGFQSG